MGILRGIEIDALAPVVESAITGGLTTLEITMNTRDAPRLIRQTLDIAGDSLAVGAGTVLDSRSLEAALDAGASFVVMPTLVNEVVEACLERGIPVFPGALTPQEIHSAWRAGASMVKVFPAKFFGPDYFTEIKGPFDDVLLLACGGVSAESLGAYSKAGADAFAFGASVFRPDWIEAGEYRRITDAIQALRDAYAEARSAKA
ncbi:bifunctional 4-hydroxy-2-oxoglutarate aldolase/2-dehydro-3-deoxy-phosphogluconate aldolase [Myxococcota bacterium]|nr:bifunctional 4-hydroxy-2-oxoglutarate aldolase/2-dehydro-3-deoxy-phosphogluconate aldolase [Myxococcota bacterium]